MKYKVGDLFRHNHRDHEHVRIVKVSTYQNEYHGLLFWVFEGGYVDTLCIFDERTLRCYTKVR
jgi:hypothetical protein